jgi:hypothetical protein
MTSNGFLAISDIADQVGKTTSLISLPGLFLFTSSHVLRLRFVLQNFHNFLDRAPTARGGGNA